MIKQINLKYLIKDLKIHEIAKKNGYNKPFYYQLIETPHPRNMSFLLNVLKMNIQDFIDYRFEDNFALFNIIFADTKTKNKKGPLGLDDFIKFILKEENENSKQFSRTINAEQHIICKIAFWHIEKIIWLSFL